MEVAVMRAFKAPGSVDVLVGVGALRRPIRRMSMLVGVLGLLVFMGVAQAASASTITRLTPRSGIRAAGINGLSGVSGATVAAAFGKSSVGANYDNGMFANYKIVNSATLSVPGSVTKLSVYAIPGINSPSPQALKAVIYSDSGGSPGALVATGTEVTYQGNVNGTGWFDLPFSSPVALGAGTYWIGFITGSTNEGMGYVFDWVGSSRAYSQNTFTNGPTDPFGTATQDSEQASIYATFTQSGGSPSGPVNLSAPTISGTAQVGQPLSASRGSWTESATYYFYQWKRCDSTGANCAEIRGATAPTYAVGSSDLGASLRVAVTASNSAGSSTAESSATAVVPGATGATGGGTGGSGTTGATGATGATGPPGTGGGGLPATLPSKASETGGWSATISVPAGGPQTQSDGVVSLNIPLPEEEAGVVQLVYRNEEEATEPTKPCLGSANEPTAEPGFLCVYRGNNFGSKENEDLNAKFVGFQDAVGNFPIAATREGNGFGAGTVLVVFRTEEGNFDGAPLASIAKQARLTASGSWAVTAK
jgi:hypothetical protein